MYTLVIITLIEWIYLLYVFFIYKTEYHIGPSLLEQSTQSHWLFIHDTGIKENKICPLGKALALVAISLSLLRFTTPIRKYRYWNILFDGLCVILSIMMNLNATVYLLPLLCLEWYLLS